MKITPRIGANGIQSSNKYGVLAVALLFLDVGISGPLRGDCMEESCALENTSFGHQALINLAGGLHNTAFGSIGLYSDNTGNNNTAIGQECLVRNTMGNNNTAHGAFVLYDNVIGNDNTAGGFQALYRNTGNSNTGFGSNALTESVNGNDNIAIGHSAGINLKTGSNNIYIGNAGGGEAESNQIRIGTDGQHKSAFIAGIRGSTVLNGMGVIVGLHGKLGTIVSSARFKEAIKPMDTASEAVLALKPVSFRYKKELDPNAIPQFGLVAEEVAKVSPDLVVRDEQNEPYTVRYEAVNAMLLNEFLKEHLKVKALEAKMKDQQKQINALTSALQKQASQIEKVNGRLSAGQSASRVVVNN